MDAESNHVMPGSHTEGDSSTDIVVFRDIDLDSDIVYISMGDPDSVDQEVQTVQASMRSSQVVTQEVDIDSDTVDISFDEVEDAVSEVCETPHHVTTEENITVVIEEPPHTDEDDVVQTMEPPQTEEESVIEINEPVEVMTAVDMDMEEELQTTETGYDEDNTSIVTSPVVESHHIRTDSSGSGSSKPSGSTTPPADPDYSDTVVVISGSPDDPDDPVVVEYTSLEAESMSDKYAEQPEESQTVIYSQSGALTINNNNKRKDKELDLTDQEYWFKAKSTTNMNGFFAFACISIFINIPFGVVALYLVQKGRESPKAAGGKRFGCLSVVVATLGICVTAAIIALCVLYVK